MSRAGAPNLPSRALSANAASIALLPWHQSHLEPLQADRNRKSDHAENEHPDHRDITSIERSRFHDQRTEPLDRADHLRADDDHEANAERDASAGKDSRQRRGQR